MNLSSDQIRDLLEVVSHTCDQELTCDECLGELGSFAELTLKGRPVEEAYDLVQQHLQVCRRVPRGVCVAPRSRSRASSSRGNELDRPGGDCPRVRIS